MRPSIVAEATAASQSTRSLATDERRPSASTATTATRSIPPRRLAGGFARPALPPLGQTAAQWPGVRASSRHFASGSASRDATPASSAQGTVSGKAESTVAAPASAPPWVFGRGRGSAAGETESRASATTSSSSTRPLWPCEALGAGPSSAAPVCPAAESNTSKWDTLAERPFDLPHDSSTGARPRFRVTRRSAASVPSAGAPWTGGPLGDTAVMARAGAPSCSRHLSDASSWDSGRTEGPSEGPDGGRSSGALVGEGLLQLLHGPAPAEEMALQRSAKKVEGQSPDSLTDHGRAAAPRTLPVTSAAEASRLGPPSAELRGADPAVSCFRDSRASRSDSEGSASGPVS
mmetsp:Transcript_11298/g.43614  ORF Transcript_11298/g.43614 Transcript_11298/m.43614 type:complete len:348 (-) Transcript_11298:187-1230(-)